MLSSYECVVSCYDKSYERKVNVKCKKPKKLGISGSREMELHGIRNFSEEERDSCTARATIAIRAYFICDHTFRGTESWRVATGRVI